MKSYDDDGSRPERPLYPRNRPKITNTCYKILQQTTVSDDMEIIVIIIKHFLIRPELIDGS